MAMAEALNRAISKILNCQWPGTILFNLLNFHSYDWPNSIKLSYASDTLSATHNFNIHLNPTNCPERKTACSYNIPEHVHNTCCTDPNKQPSFFAYIYNPFLLFCHL